MAKELNLSQKKQALVYTVHERLNKQGTWYDPGAIEKIIDVFAEVYWEHPMTLMVPLMEFGKKHKAEFNKTAAGA